MHFLVKIFKGFVSNAFVFTTLVFLLCVFIVNPFGEFSVNDDWIYILSVEAFNAGIYKISSYIDTSGILHLLLGAGWVKIFGFSIANLRLLSVVQATLTLLGIYFLLGLFSVSNTKKTLALLLIIANTLFLTSAMSFMTETSFLMFMVWSIYFYIRGERENNWWFIALGSIFAGASLLVRQVGIVIFIAYFISIFISNRLTAIVAKKLILSLLIAGLFFAFWNFWPKHSELITGEVTSGLEDLLSNTINPAHLPKRITGMFYIIFYFGFFMSPLLALLIPHVAKAKLIILGILSIIVANLIYSSDLFAVGNIFYIEGLYIKSNFRNNFSLFDNIFVKLFLSYYIAFFTVLMLYLFSKNVVQVFKKTLASNNFYYSFCVFLLLGMTGVLFLGNDLYDRYFLPQFIILPVFLILEQKDLLELKDLKVTRRFFILSGRAALFREKEETSVFRPEFLILVSLILFISVALQHDYAARTRLQWQQAQALQQSTGHITAIHVSSSYGHYVSNKRQNDLTIDFLPRNHGTKHICFAQAYTMDTGSKWLYLLESIDETLEHFVDNPRIYDSKKDNSISRAKNNIKHMMYNEQYFSFTHNLVGKKAYVGSWCVK